MGDVWNNWQSDWLGEPTETTVSREITTLAEAQYYGIQADDVDEDDWNDNELVP
jgi:hypothetical protein